jgi:hypothetical protein
MYGLKMTVHMKGIITSSKEHFQVNCKICIGVIRLIEF